MRARAQQAHFSAQKHAKNAYNTKSNSSTAHAAQNRRFYAFMRCILFPEA
jgi:hypothetical protein